MGATDPQKMESAISDLSEVMKRDAVTSVLLVPVWPNCTLAVGGLGHYLEERGLATTQISLIREHTEIIKPPRALWVPFELGRPFGVPKDSVYQKKVLKHALDLFERSSGPILEDFPDESPYNQEMPAPVLCPVQFEPRSREQERVSKQVAEFQTEILQLRSWYERAIKTRNRTTAGISGLSIEEVVELVTRFVGDESQDALMVEEDLVDRIRMACEDLKAYYFEAVSAQPGQRTDGESFTNWFWGETHAAGLINEMRKISLKDPSGKIAHLGKLLLVPRTQLHHFHKEQKSEL